MSDLSTKGTKGHEKYPIRIQLAMLEESRRVVIRQHEEVLAGFEDLQDAIRAQCPHEWETSEGGDQCAICGATS